MTNSSDSRDEERPVSGEVPTVDHVRDLDLEAGMAAAFHSDADRTLDLPKSARSESRDLAGTWIDSKFKLIEQIGEGGMGSVWMAEQREPVKRLVALKLIKKGMDSKSVLARFEAERQALAIMDHPNIAKILDGGLTEDGLPYFVMELVRGVPITQFCDAKRLSPQQRLDLFIPVCQAVQHAHQKGIIHRDIKPSNVLVALYDDHPVPKVIDFGIAKAMGHQSLTDRSLHTGFGDVIGTLEYMSPEQASLNNLDIDTRSDVFSLGVLLYELLAGSTPFRSSDLRQVGLLEILRVIREESPPRPSTRVSSVEEAPSVSANRGLEPKRLTSILRKELDWIVMKALEKERTRRYDSPMAFAIDIQRFLMGEAVQAHPPSALYRTRMFMRRYRRGLIATGFVVCALIVGMVGTTLGLVEAQSQRNIARERLAMIEDGNEVLTNIFDDINLEEMQAQGQPLSAVLADRLTVAARQIEATVVADPATVGRMLMKLGDALRSLGFPEKGRPVLEKAIRLLDSNLGSDHPDTLRSRYFCALAIATADDGWAEALPILAALADSQTRVMGLSDPHTLDTKGDLATAYLKTEQYSQAIKLMEENVRMYRETVAKDNNDRLSSEGNLGLAYMVAGELHRSRELLTEVLAASKAARGASHVNTLSTSLNLATCLGKLGNTAEAIQLFKESTLLSQEALGPDHPMSLQIACSLGSMQAAVGDFDQAEPLVRLARDRSLAKYGKEHASTLSAENELASVYLTKGDFAKALELFQSVSTSKTKKFGTESSQSIDSRTSEFNCLYKLNRLDEAIALASDLVDANKKIRGGDHAKTIQSMCNLALAYLEFGNFEQARLLFETALQPAEAKLGNTHPETIRIKENLALSYYRAGRPANAIPLQESVLAHRRQNLASKHYSTINAMQHLAASYVIALRVDDAIKLYEEAIVAAEGSNFPESELRIVKSNLAFAYLQTQDRGEKAIPLCDDILGSTNSRAELSQQEAMDLQGLLATAYERVGRSSEALPLRKTILQLSKQAKGENHADNLKYMVPLVRTHAALHDWQSAAVAQGDFVRLMEQDEGRSSVKLLQPLHVLGALHLLAGNMDLAIPLLEEVASRADHPKGMLATAYLRSGQPEKMEALLSAERKNSHNFANLLAICAEEFLQQDKVDRAEALVNESLDIWSQLSEDIGFQLARRQLGEILHRRNRNDQALVVLKGAHEKLDKILKINWIERGSSPLPIVLQSLIESNEPKNEELAAVWKEKLTMATGGCPLPFWIELDRPVRPKVDVANATAPVTTVRPNGIHERNGPIAFFETLPFFIQGGVCENARMLRTDQCVAYIAPVPFRNINVDKITAIGGALTEEIVVRLQGDNLYLFDDKPVFDPANRGEILLRSDGKHTQWIPEQLTIPTPKQIDVSAISFSHLITSDSIEMVASEDLEIQWKSSDGEPQAHVVVGFQAGFVSRPGESAPGQTINLYAMFPLHDQKGSIPKELLSAIYDSVILASAATENGSVIGGTLWVEIGELKIYQNEPFCIVRSGIDLGKVFNAQLRK